MLGPMAATNSAGWLPYARISASTAARVMPWTVPAPPAVNKSQPAMHGVVNQHWSAVGVPQNKRHILMIGDQRIITGPNLPAILFVNSTHVGGVTLVWAYNMGPPDAEHLAYPVQILIHRCRVVAQPGAEIQRREWARAHPAMAGSHPLDQLGEAFQRLERVVSQAVRLMTVQVRPL